MSFSFYQDLPAGWTPVPDKVFDEYLTVLSKSALHVLLYIIRRTFGFRKLVDAISIDQFLNGIKRSDGVVLDVGVGLSESAVKKGVRELLDLDLIQRQQQSDARGRKFASLYSVSLDLFGHIGHEDAPEDGAQPCLAEGHDGAPRMGRGGAYTRNSSTRNSRPKNSARAREGFRDGKEFATWEPDRSAEARLRPDRAPRTPSAAGNAREWVPRPRRETGSEIQARSDAAWLVKE